MFYSMVYFIDFLRQGPEFIRNIDFCICFLTEFRLLLLTFDCFWCILGRRRDGTDGTEGSWRHRCADRSSRNGQCAGGRHASGRELRRLLRFPDCGRALLEERSGLGPMWGVLRCARRPADRCAV